VVTKPKLAVWKLASCDGCQLTLLDCEDELLAVAGAVDIAHFTEASSAEVEGPYDVSLVEGSVTTERDARRIVEIRAASRFLVCIGACATAGGIQALRNFADVAEFTSVVYARPDYISTLATSTPVADHVKVDFELRGCPIDKRQLLELLTALLAGRKPQIPAHALPGTGHPGRLRRDLPRLRPRLLRVLRPDSQPQPHRPHCPAPPPRHDRGRSGPRVHHVQRRVPRPRLAPRSHPGIVADIVQDGTGYRADGRGDCRRQADALGQVGRLDRVYDQAPRHPVQGHGQADRVVQAEAV
jgi:Ni,Fe-hydrogenase III small subunit